ncbi:alpha/beta hydrolase [Rhodonellum sp.]|uniref:alpha/beta hydrolase n=1 Tax=Rhodonellum sp. TaxID=2231180 RepID=UPI00271D6CC7|nr:alpha/beta hydrolase [Rhodonellum sp.]MDO9551765.1 alpha/beta hydrolase [Rhodonellum sp.]
MKKQLILLLMALSPLLVLGQKVETLALYPNEAPFTKNLISEDQIGEGGRIQKVALPELTVYHPDPEKATGKAILICPGGGYYIIAIQHEGHQIAKWYSDNGILAVVLKYRLPDPELLHEHWNVPLEDAKATIKKMRANAKNWRIDDKKVGVLGFSAGGHLAASLSVHGKPNVDQKENERPDFSILIYPVISMDTAITHQGSRKTLLGEKLDSPLEDFYSTEKQIDSDSPPAFLVHSWDDKAVPVENSIRYAKNLNKYGVKTELHLFEKGGHGYGKGNHDIHGNAASWMELSMKWINDLPILKSIPKN